MRAVITSGAMIFGGAMRASVQEEQSSQRNASENPGDLPPTESVRQAMGVFAEL
jgi:hypothetical protein